MEGDEEKEKTFRKKKKKTIAQGQKDSWVGIKRKMRAATRRSRRQ